MYYQICSNHYPRFTFLTFLKKGQICSLMHLNGKDYSETIGDSRIIFGTFTELNETIKINELHGSRLTM